MEEEVEATVRSGRRTIADRDAGRSRAAARVAEMAALYHDPVHPLSLHDVATIYGLTKERVRQIFQQYQIQTRGYGETKTAKWQANERLGKAPNVE
jgi:hypothetical protein